MVAKKKSTSEQAETKGKVQVGKLKLNKETVKSLTSGEQKQVKGGVQRGTESKGATCTCPEYGC